jgi:hypothetical protein
MWSEAIEPKVVGRRGLGGWQEERKRDIKLIRVPVTDRPKCIAGDTN